MISSRNRGMTPHEKLGFVAIDYVDKRDCESLWSILEKWELSVKDLSFICETSDVAWVGSPYWGWSGFRSFDAMTLQSLIAVYKETGKDRLAEFYSAKRSTVKVETMSELANL